MHIEGFFRSLQGTFLAALIAIVVILIASWTVQKAFVEGNDESSLNDHAGFQKTLKFWTRRALLAVIILFVVHALVVGFTNRMPRNDMDRSGVYEQMNSH
jgi:hypothetical protein